ncbi:tripartite tricarboxylate transporter substrate binding protein [Schlegelella sp. S2-27]|uniref:Tripartite tricarboxylate transporter substrate binding protein n=1 Tax=Caldimonas mangrovi TaxID=2944811 RepID=A0ABT0YMT1_9BURK|nr:tripartite tricarboxylate transporter substrate binding protein [Caldimonas mangrovi]MCM5680035.1 tripartite tricarboxylate transporter substrate binding protein [Caldimonas mangrovi]
MSHRFLLTLRAWALAVCALWASPGAQAAYPDKPVTLVVPYPPGGATDVLARILAKGLTQRLGQPVVVENKAGAGTAIGAAAVARAPADGYTLLISSNTTFTVNAALKRTLPYDPQQQFEGVGLIGSSPLVLLAHPSLPASTVAELVALAQKQPGTLSFGSFGTGTTSHLAGELFRMMTGAEMLHVPYRGSAPAMTDLIGGQVSLTFDTNVAAMPQIAAGKVKAIAVTSRKRYSGLPDVPTVAEAGFPDYEMVPWIAVVAPRGLPADVRARLSKALQQTIAAPATHAELEKAGVEVAWQPGAVYDERVSRELPLLRAYVHKAKLPIE